MRYASALILCFLMFALSSVIGCASLPGKPGSVQIGRASWYGPGFHGRKTASGERFDMHALTAAHRTLPINSVVRVRSLSSGESVSVRINDRGPFAKNRVIDLSYRAAKSLGMIDKGEEHVEIEVVSVPEGR